MELKRELDSSNGTGKDAQTKARTERPKWFREASRRIPRKGAATADQDLTHSEEIRREDSQTEKHHVHSTTFPANQRVCQEHGPN